MEKKVITRKMLANRFIIRRDQLILFFVYLAIAILALFLTGSIPYLMWLAPLSFGAAAISLLGYISSRRMRNPLDGLPNRPLFLGKVSEMHVTEDKKPRRCVTLLLRRDGQTLSCKTYVKPAFYNSATVGDEIIAVLNNRGRCLHIYSAAEYTVEDETLLNH